MICLHCSAPLDLQIVACPRCGAPARGVDLSNIQTDRFQLLRQLFEAALRIPIEHRPAWARAACSNDAVLISQLQELLRRNELQTTEASTPPPTGAPARYIGPYRILRELGHGGMGVVYLALRDDGAFEKQVALKVLLRDQVSPDFILRFRNERQVLAALDHPQIARILDGGDTPDGMPYYVMEFVEGLPLDAYCEKNQLALAARIRLLQQVCLAVDYLHRAQIIHRDLKPANILVTNDGAVKLLDFGIAKHLTPLPAGAVELTSVQGAPMTPLYASPEQMAGVTTLQPSSDIYALGVIAYKLLTGRTPFDNSQEKLAQIHLGTDPPLPSSRLSEDLINIPETTSQFRRRLIGDLDQIILMALRRRPEGRYATAAAMADDLQRFLNGESVLARPGSLPARVLKFLVRKRVAVGIAACFVILLGIGSWQTYRVYAQGREADLRFAAMQQMLDSLETANPVKAESQVASVAKLRQTLETDLTRAAALKPKAVAERQEILDRSSRYLAKLAQDAAGNPALAEEVAAAYQQIGTFQEGTAGKESAMASYQAAAALLRVLPPDRLRLTAVEQRIHFLEQRVGPWKPLESIPARPNPGMAPAPAAAPRAAALVAATHAPPAPAQPTEIVRPVTSRYSAQEVEEVESRLVGVSTKAQNAELNLEPLRLQLEQKGLTLSPVILADLSQMRNALLRARQQFGEGQVDAARDSLNAADAFATRVLRAAGR